MERSFIGVSFHHPAEPSGSHTANRPAPRKRPVGRLSHVKLPIPDPQLLAGAYTFSGFEVNATWGSQSWLQPPFEAARARTPKTILLLQRRDLAYRQKRPPERRLQPGLAAPRCIPENV